MFGLGAEVLEATCVTESLAACLLQHGREDLVLLKGHSLELYRVQDDGLANLYGCFRFPSRILAAGRIPRGDGQPDHLILAFPDSKVFKNFMRSANNVFSFPWSGLAGSWVIS